MVKRASFLGLSTIPALTRSLMAVGVVVLAAACGKSATEPEIEKPPVEQPPVDQPPAVTGIQLQNNTQHTVVNVYIKSCSAADWGEDRYPYALGPGESTTFPDLSPGCYDIYVESSDQLGALFRNVTVTTGATTPITVTN